MCPPAMQLECAVRVRTPRQVVGLSRWVHPFCGQALTALRLNAPDKCCFCVNDTSARQWLRMQCGHTNCDLVMHSACALREAARGNCEILVQAATTDQPGTFYHFGAPRQFIVRCPSHVRKYAVPTGGQAVRIGMPAMYSVTHSRMSPAPDRIYCIYDRVVDGTSSTTSTTQVLT